MSEEQSAQSPKQVRMQSSVSGVHRFVMQFSEDCEQVGVKPEEQQRVSVAMTEIVLNAVKHGNHEDRAKNVEIQYSVTKDEFHAEVTDEGEGFDPEQVPDPTAEENLTKPGGRGIAMTKHFMDEIEYKDGGRKVAMKKKFSQDDV